MTQTLIPTLAAVLSFVTYSLTGHELTVATIFASLQLFNIVQAPMTQLPMVITSLSDNHIAMQRISRILTAEEQPHSLLIDKAATYAVEMRGDFTYETASQFDTLANETSKTKQRDMEAEKERALLGSKDIEVKCDANPMETQPFMLKDIDLRIPRGSLVCIFGKIGAGKSALLEGLLGEMRQLHGTTVSFGGRLSLVTQTPWIQNASLKDNILFGKGLDAGRLQKTIHACALTKDLEQLNDGIDTEIGGMLVFVYGSHRMD